MQCYATVAINISVLQIHDVPTKLLPLALSQPGIGLPYSAGTFPVGGHDSLYEAAVVPSL